MIIPVRCFTCGKVLANKWKAYENEVKLLKESQEQDDTTDNNEDLALNFEKGLKGKILDKLYVDRMCCRRHLLSHIDLIDII